MTELSWAGDESLGSTSSSLIRKVKDHDQEAWRHLVRLYGPLVQFWLSQSNLQPADAHDVFQEVFASVARGIDRFHKDQPGSSFRGWLRIVVRSRVGDHFRRASSQPAASGGSAALSRLQEIERPKASLEEQSEERRLLREARIQALQRIRGEFRGHTWDAFWRVAVEGQRPKDVAEDLGITPSAVRLAKSRVLRRLREELGDS